MLPGFEVIVVHNSQKYNLLGDESYLIFLQDNIFGWMKG